jgi:hypothetical protein
MDKPKTGFVSLASLRGQPVDPKTVLEQIRHIYFRTTKKTIQHDIAHAIELLMSLPSEEEREKASVYMEGLAQMRRDWTTKVQTSKGKGQRSEAKGQASKGKGKL